MAKGRRGPGGPDRGHNAKPARAAEGSQECCRKGQLTKIAGRVIPNGPTGCTDSNLPRRERRRLCHRATIAGGAGRRPRDRMDEKARKKADSPPVVVTIRSPMPMSILPSGSSSSMAVLCISKGNISRSSSSEAKSLAVPRPTSEGVRSAAGAIWQTSTRTCWLPDWIYSSKFGLRSTASCPRGPVSSMARAGGEGIVNVLSLMDRRIEIRLQPASWTREPVETGNFPPEHLLVLVHGILASPTDWKYAEGELKAQLGNRYLIYASAVNSYLSTLNGIDSAGQRLAEEVGFIVKRTPSLKRISFLGHSLGGLFARYAIAVLYASPAGSLPHTGNRPPGEELESRGERESENGSQKPTIAGLEPINFITLASPHLGVRGRQQLPFLLGLPVLEKLAAPLAPFFVGSTGRQLFLTDGKPSDPPLLLRMATNCDEGQFISALGAFKVRTVYANVSYDQIHRCGTSTQRVQNWMRMNESTEPQYVQDMVGWRTASIRREGELTKPPRQSLPGYKHVVNVLDCPPVECSGPHFEEGTAKAKEAIQRSPTCTKKAAAYHDILEEEIIRGLQQVGWRKVDVSFHAALWPFLAHNHIHVKQEWLHHEGAGVVRHVTDTLKETDQKPRLPSRL